MPWTLDARIPLVILADPAALPAALAAGGPAALLAEASARASPQGAVAAESFAPAGMAHPAACTCCAGRSPAATALDRLFQARVRGSVPWFERVVVLAGTKAGQAEIAAALAEDAVTAARFRAG
jgi:hypothetical protein